ncbi:hypothetical protein [Streptomyces lavendofoliae]|uniref:hypothetical protein n=1 Tax=Streptomyces lavendofoliae TaxID=67314 RepID=UPI003D8E4D53
MKATCGAPECAKARERERKRAVRAKARGEAPTPPVEPGLSSEAEGAFLAPWGQAYASEAEAWADCLLTGGLDGLGVVSPREQYERLRMLSPVTDSAEYQVF